MDCTASSLSKKGWLVRFAACLLIAGTAAAQVPIVPTDHFGPPDCGTPQSLRHRASVAKAEAEQALGARSAGALLAAEPLENFGVERYKLADYADCVGNGGCYWADLDAQYRRAEVALAAQIASAKPGEKLSIVMDIDETTLTSYCEMELEDYGYIASMWNGWVVSPEAAVAIPGALRLFHEARTAGVSVFFLTGRPGVPAEGVVQEDQTPATASNLEAAGFHGWTGLRLRNGAENGMATIEYKSEERAKIVAKGYRLLLSVGDQWSDLLGEPQAAVSVKLPNPFYFLP